MVSVKGAHLTAQSEVIFLLTVPDIGHGWPNETRGGHVASQRLGSAD